ncbi:MAG: AMP-binding protein [Clostridia bacterium]|nr:AMP-binding protein [Clostridia bacterium]
MRSEHQLHEQVNFSDYRALVEWAANTHKDKYAYSYKSDLKKNEVTRISFTTLRDDVRALTSKLIEMGCEGKHCVVIGKLSYEWAVLYYSIIIAGGVIVPLDRDWHAEELAKTAKKADASLLFIESELSDKSEIIAAENELLFPPVLMGGKGSGIGVDSLILDGKDIFKNKPERYFQKNIDPYKLALLVFTSGTTGEGKGVMLTQNAVLEDVSNIAPYIDYSDKTLGVLPPHHTYGSSVTFVAHTMIGSEVYISAGIRYIQKELRDEKPGHLALVPLYLETFYRKIMANVKEQKKEFLLAVMLRVSNLLRKLGIDVRKKLFSSVRAAFGGEVKMIISGGAPINAKILKFFEGIGISTLNGYGITECAPIIAVNRSKNVVHGSVGNVIDVDTVVIDSPNEAGEGEIWVKGPNVMLGYYKNEEATRDAITEDGYFKTGDYGKLDKNNILYITGRKKNLIILSNGKNVYPEEIENDLVATPGVLDIIVYEGQSKRGLEYNAIVAEIYPDKDYVEKNNITDIKRHLWSYIEEYNKTAVPYKKIGILKVREEEFPKNTLRKIMRFKLDISID